MDFWLFDRLAGGAEQFTPQGGLAFGGEYVFGGFGGQHGEDGIAHPRRKQRVGFLFLAFTDADAERQAQVITAFLVGQVDDERLQFNDVFDFLVVGRREFERLLFASGVFFAGGLFISGFLVIGRFLFDSLCCFGGFTRLFFFGVLFAAFAALGGSGFGAHDEKPVSAATERGDQDHRANDERQFRFGFRLISRGFCLSRRWGICHTTLPKTSLRGSNIANVVPRSDAAWCAVGSMTYAKKTASPVRDSRL